MRRESLFSQLDPLETLEARRVPASVSLAGLADVAAAQVDDDDDPPPEPEPTPPDPGDDPPYPILPPVGPAGPGS